MGWNVGDKAVCIMSGTYTREGEVYTVINVSHPGSLYLGKYPNTHPYPILRFAEIQSRKENLGSGAERFRKVIHDEPKGECETDFRTLLKSRELVVLK